jgi:hypothetical protein
MISLHHRSIAGWLRAALICLALRAASVPESAWAINFLLDYRYDSSEFFLNNQPARDALQAAANRYAAVITEPLSAASLTQSGNTDHRIEFTHPGTGLDFEVSAASNIANDGLAPPNCTAGPLCYTADHYRGPWMIAANQMVIFPGARALPDNTAAEASSGTGLNFNTAFSNGNSHLNRGFRNSFSQSNPNIPMWGGAISFDQDTNWHFNHTTAAPSGKTDFYSIALHEIGHILGLSTVWNEWARFSSGDQFSGDNTVPAYNADNGTSVASLNLVIGGEPHFRDGSHDSYIFQNASPNLVGTVGTSAKQDLLMEPTANFTGAIRRFELTNVDVAALRDLGWSTVPQITSQPGDYNKNGIVDAADHVVFRKGFADGNYATWKANFGEGGASSSSPPDAGVVPEPTIGVFLLTTLHAFLIAKPPRSD